jgi:DNA-binding NarL/FixJ family response regulator
VPAVPGVRGEVWEVAREVCTERQLRVLELHERHGESIYQIGFMMDLSPSTVRGHLRAATRNVRRAVEQSAVT